MEFSFEPFNPETPGSVFDSAVAMRNLVIAERDPDYGPVSPATFRSSLSGTDRFEQVNLIAQRGDEVVGLATVNIYHMETNTDKAEVEIEVHPAMRRRGIGTGLLAATLEVVTDAGRTTLGAYNRTSESANGFWASVGADLKTIERESRLWLAETDQALMQTWLDQRQKRAADYTLEHYKGPTPPHLIPAVVHLNNVMNDAPRDDADWEDDSWTESDVIDLDKLIAGRGRERWVSLVFDPNGEPAGQTTVSIPSEKPKFGFQGNTSVDSKHRSRGLGRWLKADMWFRLRNEAPAVEALDTDNAASNAPMLAINVAMGFKPLAEWGYYQAEVDVMRAHLAARSK